MEHELWSCKSAVGTIFCPWRNFDILQIWLLEKGVFKALRKHKSDLMTLFSPIKIAQQCFPGHQSYKQYKRNNSEML